MGVTKVLKVLSGGGAENEPDIEWYYVAPPADLHLHVLSLYCTVTFFDGCVWRITSKLQSQPFQNSRIAHSLLNYPVNHWIKALSHLLHYAIDFACFSHDQNEQNSERELIVSLSLLDLF